jgi:hypothetical protein
LKLLGISVYQVEGSRFRVEGLRVARFRVADLGLRA